MKILRLFRSFLQARKYYGFTFQDPGVLRGDGIELRLTGTSPANAWEGATPEYHFHIYIANTDIRAGFIDFRVFLTNELKKFGGNIGYGIYRPYRGKYYAAKAVKLLLDFVRGHKLSSLLITCEETNIASRKTCELLGARLVKTENARTDMDEIKPICYYVLELKE